MTGAPDRALPARCDIWWRAARVVAEADLALLDETEHARAERFRRTEDRARFVTAAALLRRTAAQWLGCDPRALVVDRSCARCGEPHGKPEVAGVHVSVTHAGEYAGVALTALGPVGLDIEPADAPVGEVAAQMLAPDESCADDAQLVRMWTRKESVVKATGDGLSIGLSHVLVSPPDTTPALREYRGTRDVAARMADLRAVPGYIASATVLTTQSVRWVEHLDG